MGYNSIILICNDDMNDIDSDPISWWNNVKQAINGNKTGRNINFELVSCEHADYINVIIAGGNTAKVIGFTSKYTIKNRLYSEKWEAEVLKKVLKQK